MISSLADRHANPIAWQVNLMTSHQLEKGLTMSEGICSSSISDFLKPKGQLNAVEVSILIAENVLGLLSASQGYCFGTIIEKICELGYSITVA